MMQNIHEDNSVHTFVVKRETLPIIGFHGYCTGRSFENVNTLDR